MIHYKTLKNKTGSNGVNKEYPRGILFTKIYYVMYIYIFCVFLRLIERVYYHLVNKIFVFLCKALTLVIFNRPLLWV